MKLELGDERVNLQFMFLGQIKFVLGPGWQAKKKKKKMKVVN